MYQEQDEFTCEDWTTLLSVSSRLLFDGLRRLCIGRIEKLAKQIAPADRIVLAKKFDVPQLLSPAYLALCTRRDPLSDDEARKIGFEEAFKLATAREECFRATLKAGTLLSCGHCVFSLQCSKCLTQPAWRSATSSFQTATPVEAKACIGRMFNIPDVRTT